MKLLRHLAACAIRPFSGHQRQRLARKEFYDEVARASLK
jgi:hypothetical protein